MILRARNRQLAILEPKPHRLSPEKLGLLAKRLAAAKDPKKTARLRQRITQGFYTGHSRENSPPRRRGSGNPVR